MNKFFKSIIALFLSTNLAFGQTISPNSFCNNPIHTSTQSKLYFGVCRVWGNGNGSTNVSWPTLETARGVYNWTNMDNLVSYCKSQGQQMYYSLGGTPGWANGSQPIYIPPTDFNDEYTFLTALATRYAGNGIQYTPQNEPNILNENWNGTQTQLLSLAQNMYSIVHAADPTASVGTPDYSWDSNGFQKFQAYMAAGGGNYADFMAFHCYPYQDYHDASVPPLTPPEQMWSEMILVQQIIQANGQGGKPLVCTEGGWTTIPFSNLSSSQLPPWSSIWLLLLTSAGLKTECWYAYDANTGSGSSAWGPLWDGNATGWLNDAGIAMRLTQGWLSGATYTNPIHRVLGTSVLTNTTGAGMVAGTPGTPPTGMTINNPDSGHGVNTQWITGATVNGITYVSFRTWGTPTTGAAGYGQIHFGNNIAWTPGNYETLGVYLTLASGSSMTGINNINMVLTEKNGSGTTLGNSMFYQLFPITSSIDQGLQEYTVPNAYNTIATITPLLQWSTTVGTAFDMTINFAIHTLDPGTQWTGTITKPGGYQAEIDWDASGGPTSYTPGVTYTNWHDIYNNSGTINGTVSLTNSPILLDNQAAGGFISVP